jgi:hypothetical protein
MADRHVIQAVTTRLQGFSTVPVRLPNTAFPPDNEPSSFLDLQFPVAISEQMSIGAPGANVWRESGAFRFVLSIERTTGADTAGEVFEELRDMFRGVVFDGVVTGAPTSPITNDDSDEGAYFTMSMSVPYTYDQIG